MVRSSARRSVTALASLVAGLTGTLAAPPPASANGRFPAASQLVVSPASADELVLRATFGVVVSRDRGAGWDWVCERAMGYGGEQDPSVGVTASRALVVGSLDGLTVSDPSACLFRPEAAFSRQAVRDVVVRPDAPNTVYAVTSTYSGYRGNVPTYDSQVFVSRDGGATWSKRGEALDPLVFVETIEVSASDPQRLYVGAVTGPEAARASRLLVSRDEGLAWTDLPVPTKDVYERASFVSAVSPTNADRVYVRSSGNGVSRLLVTDDGGASFRVVLDAGPMLGFALSPDGARVFAGSPQDGLYVASSADLAFTKRSSLPVRCLATRGTTLYVCSDDAAGFTVGASEDEGQTFAPLLSLAGVRGPLACPIGTEGAVCPSEWTAVRERLRGAPDAGAAADAGPASPTAPSAAQSSACTSTTRGGEVAKHAAWLASGAAVVALARRLRRRRA